MNEICACTPICEEDAGYIPQYLAEVERLGVQFAVYFDNCSPSTIARLKSHPLYLGGYVEDRPIPYQENFRQFPHAIAVEAGCKVAILWDINETWERAAPSKLVSLSQREDWDNLLADWYNIWGDAETIRVDNPSAPSRTKALRLDSGIEWVWKGGIVMSPYAKGDKPIRYLKSDLVCLNWGLRTQELREQHKARWDRIYGRMSKGKNPYGYWDWLLDEVSHPPQLLPNPYR